MVDLETPKFGEENRINLFESYLRKRNPDRWYPSEKERENIKKKLGGSKKIPVIISPKQSHLAYYVERGIVLSSLNIPSRDKIKKKSMFNAL